MPRDAAFTPEDKRKSFAHDAPYARDARQCRLRISQQRRLRAVICLRDAMLSRAEVCRRVRCSCQRVRKGVSFTTAMSMREAADASRAQHVYAARGREPFMPMASASQHLRCRDVTLICFTRVRAQPLYVTSNTPRRDATPMRHDYDAVMMIRHEEMCAPPMVICAARCLRSRRLCRLLFDIAARLP